MSKCFCGDETGLSNTRHPRIVGEVSTCPGHNYLDPGIIPAVETPAGLVPGTHQRVGGKDENGHTFYGWLEVRVGESPAAAARQQYPKSDVGPMGDGELSTRILTLNDLYPHGTINDRD